MRIYIVATEHYFSADPASAAAPTKVEFAVAGRNYALTAAAGVFSAGRLDAGTGVLLRRAALPDADAAGPLLDLGCGYGAIACVLASVAPSARVIAVDVNARARQLCATNATALGLGERIAVAAPEEVDPGLTFAQIWSNPPIRIGKVALHELLLAWLPRLRPGGVAWLVVGRHLGADSLAAWLADQGWLVHRQASQQGFRVLRVSPGSGPSGRAADGSVGAAGKSGDVGPADPQNV